MSTFGSTKDEDAPAFTEEEMRKEFGLLQDAKMSLNEKATVEGLWTRVDVVRQQIETTQEQMRALLALYATLSDEFAQFREQWYKQLNVRVNGGSTTPEDIDGPDIKRRN